MHVLISEVAGAGRWSQFNLKLDWVPQFFGQNAASTTTVQLCRLGSNGAVTEKLIQTSIYKPASKNWAFEIPGAADLTYPGKIQRPILVISQNSDGWFPFELVMPTEMPYQALADFLSQNRQTPARQLSRCMVARNLLPIGNFGLNI